MVPLRVQFMIRDEQKMADTNLLASDIRHLVGMPNLSLDQNLRTCNVGVFNLHVVAIVHNVHNDVMFQKEKNIKHTLIIQGPNHTSTFAQ